MLRKASRKRSETGVTVQTMLLITVFVLAVGASGVWVFNLVRDTGDSLEQAARGKLIYQADCDLQFAQPRARPLPWGMTEDPARNDTKLLIHNVTVNGNARAYRYWEFPLTETLDEAREKAELNLTGNALQDGGDISLTARVDKLRFYDRWAQPFRSLSEDTPQESVNIRYPALPQYMHSLFEDAIPDAPGNANSFQHITPAPTKPPADFLRLVENLVIAFNPRDGCWGFRLQGVEPPPPAATTTTSSTSSTSSTTTSSTSSTTTTSSTSSTSTSSTTTTTTSSTTTTTTAAPPATFTSPPLNVGFDIRSVRYNYIRVVDSENRGYTNNACDRTFFPDGDPQAALAVSQDRRTITITMLTADNNDPCVGAGRTIDRIGIRVVRNSDGRRINMLMALPAGAVSN